MIHYSQRFANLLGNNPVSVLETLVLLSHAKILCTLITVVTLNIQTAIARDGCGCIMQLLDPLLLVPVFFFLFLFILSKFLVFGQ